MPTPAEDAQQAKVHAIAAHNAARGAYQKEMAEALIYLARASKGTIEYLAPPTGDDD